MLLIEVCMGGGDLRRSNSYTPQHPSPPPPPPCLVTYDNWCICSLQQRPVSAAAWALPKNLGEREEEDQCVIEGELGRRC